MPTPPRTTCTLTDGPAETSSSDLQEDSSTFVTPSISVNAFNRAQTDNDLYFSLFKLGKTAALAGQPEEVQPA